MRRYAVLMLAAFVLLGAGMMQSTSFTSVGFLAPGSADWDVTITRTETSGVPELQLIFTTSDTVEYVIKPDSMVWEGATADASEHTFTITDPTADITTEFRDDKADTYYPLTNPDADITGGYWAMPLDGAVDTDDSLTTNVTDNEMIVYVVYIDRWITVDKIVVYGDVLTDSASDELIGVAIYENADAGVQLTTGTSTDFTADAVQSIDVTNVTLGPGMYRIGVCSGDISGVAAGAHTIDDEVDIIVNGGDTDVITSAANACTAAVPASTTGALTASTSEWAIIKLDT